MIRRPLNKRFREAVLAGKKTTTIRDKAWPVGEPIMLFNWSGAPYRSKQVDVTAITVKGFWTIRITHGDDGVVSYECGREGGPRLYETEGFESQAEMDDWFRPLVKRGETVEKVLMCFCLGEGWTKKQASELQKITREIIKHDGGDHNIHRMSYQCEVRVQGDSAGEGCISLKRWEMAKMRQEYALLRDHPKIQAERIARHYAAHAQMAVEMLKAIEFQKQAPHDSGLHDLIDHHMRVITENHRNDFGIELAWQNNKEEARTDDEQ